MKKKDSKLKSILTSNPAGIVINLLVVYLCYFICRLAFLFENWRLFADVLNFDVFIRIMRGGFLFDTSAIFYTNALIIILYLLPLHIKENKPYHLITKILYVIINSVAVCLNLADAVFFEFHKHRTSMEVFEEFHGENNLGSLLGVELVNHWYFVLLAAALIFLLWKCYRMPGTPTRPRRRYYITQSVTLVIFIPIAVFGMRGNTFFAATRPIAVSYAHKYVTDPLQTGIVLNTPFSIIRTVNQLPEEIPTYFTDPKKLESLYSPLHVPADTVRPNKKNIVILIVESFAQEFVGALNPGLDNGTYQGYTPFFDSLLPQSLYYEQSFANTSFSIDAPPAILASIPRMDRPFMLSPYSLNHLNSLATTTANLGYSSAFFHGADNESLGFNAFVKSIGYEKYFGKNEFVADKRFGAMKEFDGKWGIWDEPFLQFFAAELNEMKQPFLATVFTLSSHHPFKVPEKYKDVFKDEGKFPLHKCIRYADYSLKRFFETASKMPWFKNTIFVITADHASSKRTHPVYFGEVGGYRVPIAIYDPSGETPRGKHPGIMQQIDIMPTLLTLIGYNRAYMAFGKDVLNTPVDKMWAFNWDLYAQYFKGEYVIRADGGKITEIYNYVKDPYLKQNLIGKLPEQQQLTDEMHAIMQTYSQLMKSNAYSH